MTGALALAPVPTSPFRQAGLAQTREPRPDRERGQMSRGQAASGTPTVLDACQPFDNSSRFATGLTRREEPSR